MLHYLDLISWFFIVIYAREIMLFKDNKKKNAIKLILRLQKNKTHAK